MPPRKAPPSPLAVSAEQRGNAIAQMQQSSQQLRDTRANTSARFAARQAQPRGIAPPNTTNAMSDAHAEASFNGTFGSGIGTAPSTWSVSKWRQPQQV
jgi:hypothetical protein